MLPAESHQAALCTAVHEQPACFAAFEAALRSMGMRNQLGVDAHAGSKYADRVMTTLAPSGAAACMRIAASYTNKPQLQLQLFSLCVSCLKHAALSMEAQPAPKLVPAFALGTLMLVCRVGSSLFDATFNSSSSGAAGGNRSSSSSNNQVSAAAAAAAAAEPWVVLLARCLLLGSIALERITLCDAEAGRVRNAAAAAYEALVVSSDSLGCILRYIVHAVPAAASPQHLDACVEMHRRLQELLAARLIVCKHGVVFCSCNRCAAAGMTDVFMLTDLHAAVQQEGLAEQMQVYGELLTSLLPLPHVCNNPGCVSLEQRSELVLASAKGSRCSCCKVAR
jgi:hypothetical protein